VPDRSILRTLACAGLLAALLGLSAAPALAQEAQEAPDPTVKADFGSDDGNIQITVSGPGVPGGSQTVDGGWGQGIDLRDVNAGDALHLDARWIGDPSLCVVSGSWSQLLPGAGSASTAAWSPSADLILPAVDPAASRSADLEYPNAVIYRPSLEIAACAPPAPENGDWLSWDWLPW
jgi:hypothetical protein